MPDVSYKNSESPLTTKLYDRITDQVGLGEIERI